jgi:hypothetical protein
MDLEYYARVVTSRLRVGDDEFERLLITKYMAMNAHFSDLREISLALEEWSNLSDKLMGHGRVHTFLAGIFGTL